MSRMAIHAARTGYIEKAAAGGRAAVFNHIRTSLPGMAGGERALVRNLANSGGSAPKAVLQEYSKAIPRYRVAAEAAPRLEAGAATSDSAREAYRAKQDMLGWARKGQTYDASLARARHADHVNDARATGRVAKQKNFLHRLSNPEYAHPLPAEHGAAAQAAGISREELSGIIKARGTARGGLKKLHIPMTPGTRPQAVAPQAMTPQKKSIFARVADRFRGK